MSSFADPRVRRAVNDWLTGYGNNLLILSGPQTGKTTAARWLLRQLLDTDEPTLRVAFATYRAAQARRVAGLVQLQRASRRLCWAGAVGDATSGIFDALVIDDPVRGEAEALSPGHLERQWRWWLEAGRVRLSPNGRVCVLMTQWCGADLAGMLQRHEPDEWTVVGSMARPMLATVG